MEANGLLRVVSPYSVEETVQRLENIFAEKGLKLFALIDHSGEAEKVGLKMPPTKVLIFGSPKSGTPVMLAAASLAIDLPLKTLVAEDIMLATLDKPFSLENSDRARDHLANERTFLAWVRTSIAVVVFGFAIGRFGVALRQLSALQGQSVRVTGFSVWMGTISILAGVAMVIAGLARYRKTRTQLQEGKFQPAGFIMDFVMTLTVLFGLALAGYLIYVGKSFH
jgi:uncharacterized membrane protein YidH (DUF202 family)